MIVIKPSLMVMATYKIPPLIISQGKLDTVLAKKIIFTGGLSSPHFNHYKAVAFEWATTLDSAKFQGLTESFKQGLSNNLDTAKSTSANNSITFYIVTGGITLTSCYYHINTAINIMRVLLDENSEKQGYDAVIDKLKFIKNQLDTIPLKERW